MQWTIVSPPLPSDLFFTGNCIQMVKRFAIGGIGMSYTTLAASSSHPSTLKHNLLNSRQEKGESRSPFLSWQNYCVSQCKAILFQKSRPLLICLQTWFLGLSDSEIIWGFSSEVKFILVGCALVFLCLHMYFPQKMGKAALEDST